MRGRCRCKSFVDKQHRLALAPRMAVAKRAIANRKSAVENQFTHLPPSETRIGSSSIMNCVLPIAPIMWTPVAAYHFLDISSPVWQPQLLTYAWRAKTCRLILVKSLSCSHDLHALSMLLL